MKRLAILFLLLAPSCSLFDFSHPVEVDHPVRETLEGLRTQDLLTGQGPPARMGDEVVVHYEARLQDGQVIDNSYDRGLPETFELGNAPLAGWDKGLIGMKAGGQRRLEVPPALAYGEEGIPGLVPPDAWLDFVMDLIELHPK